MLGFGYLLALVAPWITFSLLIDAISQLVAWCVPNWSILIPPLLWFSTTLVAAALPLLPVPPLDPEPAPSRRERRHRYTTLSRSHAPAQFGGASRYGYHRQFPLRCRATNLHTHQPSATRRLLMPALQA